MTLIVSMPPRSLFKTSFVKNSKFLKKYFFFKKFRTKRDFFFCPGNRPLFFRHFFLRFFQKKIMVFGSISKNAHCLVLVVSRHSRKFQRFFLRFFVFSKKIELFFCDFFECFRPSTFRSQVRILPPPHHTPTQSPTHPPTPTHPPRLYGITIT